MMTHECAEKATAESGTYGAAIEDIFQKEDGSWWAMSGINEYFSQIDYCPFCGVKL
jgi:hypothetical protein